MEVLRSGGVIPQHVEDSSSHPMAVWSPTQSLVLEKKSSTPSSGGHIEAVHNNVPTAYTNKDKNETSNTLFWKQSRVKYPIIRFSREHTMVSPWVFPVTLAIRSLWVHIMVSLKEYMHFLLHLPSKWVLCAAWCETYALQILDKAMKLDCGRNDNLLHW